MANAQIVEFVGLNGYNVETNQDELIQNQKSNSIIGFSGAIIHYDLNYRWTSGSIFEDGLAKFTNAAITRQNTFAEPASSNKAPLYLSILSNDGNGNITISNYKYLFTPTGRLRLNSDGSGSGSGVASGMGGQLSGVTIVGTPGGGGTGGGTGTGGSGGVGGNPPPTGGGSGGNNGGSNSSLVVAAPASSQVISDIHQYLKCFSSNVQMTLTVYAEQPVPNTRETHDGTDPGHSFITLQQSQYTKTFGYYPSTGVYPLVSPTATRAWVDDSGHPYTVKYTINVPANKVSQVFNTIYGISTTYNLNSNNCTTVAISIANAAGALLPSTTGTWPGGGGCNPGDFGQDLRGMPGAVTTAGFAPANSGACP